MEIGTSIPGSRDLSHPPDIDVDTGFNDRVESIADDIRTDFITGKNMDICEDFHDRETDVDLINKILAEVYHSQMIRADLLIPLNDLVETTSRVHALKQIKD